MVKTDNAAPELASLARPNLKLVPKHIAVIMDGNRRWARLRNRPSHYGHHRGAEVVNDIVEAACDLGVETLTLFAFSTENWNRSKIEVKTLHNILEIYLYKMRKKMIRNGIRLETIGDLSPFSDGVKKAITEVKEATKGGGQLNLVLALNYGGRDEIRRAAIAACQKLERIEDLTEEMLSEELDTAQFGDPEMIIRPSGENRLSNFLLWQAQYAELISTPVLWPDFNKKYFYDAITQFQSRHRRRGE